MTLAIIPEALLNLPGSTLFDQHLDSFALQLSLNSERKDLPVYVTEVTLVLVSQGCLQVKEENGRTISIQAREWVLVKSDLFRISYRPTSPKPFEAVFFVLGKKTINRTFSNTLFHFSDTELLQSAIQFSGTNRTDQIVQNFIQPREVIQEMEGFLDSLTQLFQAFNSCPGGDKFLTQLSEAHRPHKQREFSAFMECHFHLPLTLEQFAALTGQSLNRFNQRFKDEFGQTPKQWIIRKRMDLAHRLLTIEGLSIGTVAVETGYVSKSHFIEAYKRHFGNTPGRAIKRSSVK